MEASISKEGHLLPVHTKVLYWLTTTLIVVEPGENSSISVLGQSINLAGSRWRCKWKAKKWSLRECRQCCLEVWLTAEVERLGTCKKGKAKLKKEGKIS